MTTQIDYQQLAAALTQEALKHSTPAGSPSNIYAHGSGGLLSQPGLRRGIANAMIMPNLGLMSKLPARTSNEENPLLGIFTGVTATSGSEPDGRCDDPPVAGVSKLCTHTFAWGWFGRRSRELRLDRMGTITNRGEFTDMELMGNPFSAPNVPDAPVNGFSVSQINTEYGKLLFELGVAMVRDQGCDLYTGNPSNNTGTAGNGGREYFYGLDSLINTGYRDAITGQACPAADSIVRSFSGNISSDGTAAVNAVREITYILRNLKWIALQTGLAPVQFALSMSWGLFYELTAIWPCAYQTYRCDVEGTNNRRTMSADNMNRMTDEMRGNQSNMTGQYLLVDGERIEVCIDSGCPTETETSPGVFSSDIYFVPLVARGGGGGAAPLSEGGNLLTYMEYFNFDMQNGPMAAARMLAPAGAYETSQGGRYLFHKYYPKNLCVQIAGWVKSRLVLETPYLASRLTGVGYEPLIHERQPFTDDAYFVNGGRTDYIGYGPSYYSPTS